MLLLPVTDLFQFLRLKAEPSATLDTLSGFIVDEEKQYLIDNRNKQIHFNGQQFHVDQNRLIKTETALYLDHLLFGEIFGLYCRFNFRSLSVEIKPDFELPVIREIRLRQFRKNIEQLKGDVEADTTLNREYHVVRFGMVDWAVSSTQSTTNTNDTRVWLATGAELAGGETNLLFNYSTRDGLNHRNQQYYWCWANNQPRAIRQVRIGKIAPLSISSIYDPVLGISATNARTTYRRSFGEYTITDYTEPGWTVELYVNNVIVDYQTADASGFYSFDVPLVYGTSQVMLKFYGPYGEERIREQFLNIPFNFLPPGELEYTVSSGMVLDGEHSRFGRAEAIYGLNRFLTFGGGFEYLSSVVTETDIPFLTASLTPVRNLMITSEYAKGVRTKALGSYRLASGPLLELEYANYVHGQKAIRLNYLEEKKATLSLPLRFSWFNGYSRMSYRQNVYEMLTYNTDEKESVADGLTVRMNGERVIRDTKDSIIRITGLEPYTSYLLTLDDKELNQISYRIRHKNIRVFVNPNQFKRIEIPVKPMGEVNRWIFIKDENGTRGQGRILVNIFTKSDNLVTTIMTERDGGFTYLGLSPGDYYAREDSAQITRLNLEVVPEYLEFQIQPDFFSEIVYDLEFLLSKPDERTKEIFQEQQEAILTQNAEQGSFENRQNELTPETILNNNIRNETGQKPDADTYSIQIGALENQRNAKGLAENFENSFEFPVFIDFEEGLYKVKAGIFKNLNEA